MNEIQKLHSQLLGIFPDIKYRLDEPLIETGVWSLDIFPTERHIAIAWKSSKGFGIVFDMESHGYGEGAQEVYESLDEVLPRITELINS